MINKINKILVITLLFFWGITNLYSQSTVLEKLIDINAKNIKLVKVLGQISKKTGYFFTYNPEFILENTIVNYTAENTAVKDILNNILQDSSLIYNIIDNHIIISKSNKIYQNNKGTNIINNTIIEVSGKVLNAKTLKPLSFASVGILNTTIGTITNKNGVFNIKFDIKYTDSTFFVANISYKTKFIKIKNLNTSIDTFKLSENFVSIQEVIIRSHNPITILEKAIKNIHVNYSQKTSILTAFYREGIVKKKNILNFSEAIINIYNTPYKFTPYSEKIKVYKSRKIINTIFSDTVFVKLKGGLYSSLQLDIIKYPIDFLKNIAKNDYIYQLTDIVTFGNKLVYVINFKQRKDIQDALYKGNIYVETKSYAIIACDFEVNFSAVGYKPNFVLKKKFKIKTKTQSAKYHITYRNINGIYYLNHLRADVNIKIKKNRHLFFSKYNAFLENVIFDIDTLNIKKFSRKDIEKINSIFIDNNYSYDKKFWGEKNFIEPEVSIEKALNKIKAKLNINYNQ